MGLFMWLCMYTKGLKLLLIIFKIILIVKHIPISLALHHLRVRVRVCILFDGCLSTLEVV